MSVAGSQVQRRVISSVHDVDACPSHDEHVHHAGATLPAGPVEGAEAVVISTEKHSQKHLTCRRHKPTHMNQLDTESKNLI